MINRCYGCNGWFGIRPRLIVMPQLMQLDLRADVGFEPADEWRGDQGSQTGEHGPIMRRQNAIKKLDF